MPPFTRPPIVRRGDRLVALSVLLVLLAVFTATMMTHPGNYDGETEFQTTSALAREHTFALGGTPEADAIVAWRHAIRPGGPGREDEVFSWYGVGQALVGVPFFVVGATLGRMLPELEEANSEEPHQGVHRSEYFEHLAVAWRNTLLSAMTAGLIVLSSRRLGASRTSSYIGGLSYGLCSFAWGLARSVLNMAQATFFLFFAFSWLLVARESTNGFRRPARHDLVVLGVALGGAFLTRSVTAPVVGALGLATLVQLLDAPAERKLRAWLLDAAALTVPALALFGVFLWTNWVRFGDPLESGYGAVIDLEFFNYPLHLGLLQILFAPGQGMFPLAPAALLALPWLVSTWRGGDHATPAILVAVALGVLLPVSMMSGWYGGGTYGPRYALPLLPFLWCGVAPMLDKARTSYVWRPITVGLLGLGFVVTLPGALVDPATHNALALEAARVEWPDLPGDGAAQETAHWQLITTDMRFAAPWVHWRILRHRVAGLGEEFPLDEIFFVVDDRPEVLAGEVPPVEFAVPPNERDKGFNHLAWVDFSRRIGGPVWPIVGLCLAFLVAGIVLAVRGLDPDQP